MGTLKRKQMKHDSFVKYIKISFTFQDAYKQTALLR